LFIFRGIWNPCEASFAKLCYVPIQIGMGIALHACMHGSYLPDLLPGCQLADGQNELPSR